MIFLHLGMSHPQGDVGVLDLLEQKLKQLKSKQAHEKQLKRTIVTEMKAATSFYDAEDYHQDYKIKNPLRYKVYRWNCGRDQRLNEIWK